MKWSEQRLLSEVKSSVFEHPAFFVTISNGICAASAEEVDSIRVILMVKQMVSLFPLALRQKIVVCGKHLILRSHHVHNAPFGLEPILFP